jgi:hypothetical protein
MDAIYNYRWLDITMDKKFKKQRRREAGKKKQKGKKRKGRKLKHCENY